jgi:cob(I)alamin adenosyltransferase
MGHRLSAIATRTGDAGSTGLGDGSRVSKSDPRVNAMGDIDELNSAVGLLIAFGLPSSIRRTCSSPACSRTCWTSEESSASRATHS